MQSQQQGHAPVVTCDVNECSYNESDCCCAASIEVGDQHPACDTFTTSSSVNIIDQDMSNVSACHVMECRFNASEACEAPGITVMHHESHADCGSYRPQ